MAAVFLAARLAADPMLPESLDFQPQFIASEWTKTCTKEQLEGARACYTSKNGRTESGSLVAAVLIDKPGAAPKVFRVTLPLGMELEEGTSISIDQNDAISAQYSFCVSAGCAADYKASTDLLYMLEQGKELAIRSVDGKGRVVKFVLSLAGFQEAYSSPPR